MHVLHYKNLPIVEQLKIEEELLRNCNKDYCVINEGTTPTIVMGISGKQHELVKADCEIPVIKRFSGGGTVVVDENTLFVTFISNKRDFAVFPEPIMRWTGALYEKAFNLFTLKENDYVIGNKKCGGNAQYIKKNRFLHHTSFLWDYCPKRMDTLLHPKKTPAYRQERPHSDFLCTLSPHFKSKQEFIDKLLAVL